MELFSFERLNVYKEARKLVREVYVLINRLPDNERYSIAAQLQRSITSVPSNIAEGCGRMSFKEKIHFIEISYGSLMEAYCQVEICHDLGYVSDEQLHLIRPQFFTVSKMLNALRRSYLEHLNTMTHPIKQA